MAKALGNGMPIGACWARDDVAAAFVPGDHATTFGGQPLAAAAARAVLAVMEAEDVSGPARRDAGALPGRRRSTRSPGWRRYGASGCCSPPSSSEGAAAAVAPRRSRRRPGRQRGHRRRALRLAPSLLVSDAEIDQAVADPGRGHDRLPDGSEADDAHFLEIDDLSPSELADGPGPGRGYADPPRSWPGRGWP